ncbi:cytochrome ubiquinol oxidase subunit I, partial [Vibrio cholerae]|nr:cytochrome ubiquinol oxidase subunit I [Vibrio cholerae]
FGAWRVWRNKPLPKPYMYALIGMTFSGWVATIAGWYVTEIGRQPWLVSGVLRTAEAVTPVASSSVGISLTLYLITYVVLLVAYVHTLFYLARKTGHAPQVSPSSTKAAL